MIIIERFVKNQSFLTSLLYKIFCGDELSMLHFDDHVEVLLHKNDMSVNITIAVYDTKIILIKNGHQVCKYINTNENITKCLHKAMSLLN